MQNDADELRALLSAMRTLSRRLLGHQQFGANARDLVILMALGTGPMTTLKTAQYVGMPRPTAARRLKHLEAKGLVQRREGGAFTLTQRALRKLAGPASA